MASKAALEDYIEPQTSEIFAAEPRHLVAIACDLCRASCSRRTSESASELWRTGNLTHRPFPRGVGVCVRHWGISRLLSSRLRQEVGVFRGLVFRAVLAVQPNDQEISARTDEAHESSRGGSASGSRCLQRLTAQKLLFTTGRSCGVPLYLTIVVPLWASESCVI